MSKNYICPNKTLIILDWDDTLFPTSWTTKNDIKLSNHKNRYKYIDKFDELDKLLSDTLIISNKCGKTIIVTNALNSWIEISSSVLPLTKNIMKSMDIISARERYQEYSDINEWKKRTFEDEVSSSYNNIISMGDADYEYNALVNLYDSLKVNKSKKYLKTIKFIKTNNYDTHMAQLSVIKNNVKNICSLTKHIDLIVNEK
uniref:FCP1 homology domain-containing protein n=1 Tax=viral metagenome TaxID=1070528 RepID=A0A6C0BF89_9ZZZZ